MIGTWKTPKFLANLFTNESSPALIRINQRPYRVLKKLSQTKNGTLYLCRNAFSGLCILKRQNDCFDEDDERLFQDEYQILSSLRHPNIVKAFDYGFDEDTGSFFIVMEYVQGKPLWNAVQESTEQEIYGYLFQSLQACEYLHNQGIIHCDIKPDNILITGDRTVKISDFGVGSKIGERIKGLSTAFIAPEHMADLDEATAAPETDFFALGVSFYWLLTGAHPYYPAHEPMLFQETYFKNTPVLPTTLNPTINPKWNDCLMELIHTDPCQRSCVASKIINSFNFD